MGEDAQDMLNSWLHNQEWRLNHLYWIENKNGNVQRFRMNWAQKRLWENMHLRNEILKVRQLGVSTFVALLILDCCLFNRTWHAGIIDKTVDDAKKKLAKITFAYDSLDYLPPDASEEDRALAAIGAEIKEAVRTTSRQVTSVEFNNGSEVRVGASMRGGTLQMLHVSELAYVAAHNPQRANEIRTGALQAVASGCYIIKESTHEGGRSGVNYEMVRQAMANSAKPELSSLDYRFFFFSWYENPEYELDARFWDEEPAPGDEAGRAERRKLEEVFETYARHGIVLSSRKKAWYAARVRELGWMIRQEYPTTPDEAFDQVTENSIYGTELEFAKTQGRLDAVFEADRMRATYVSYDLGKSDLTSMWLVQVGSDGRYYVLDHHACNREGVEHYAAIARSWEAKYGVHILKHFMPHDAENSQWQGASFAAYFRSAGFVVSVLPRVANIWAGINAVRRILPHCVFHARCGATINVRGREYPSGIRALENYKTAEDGANGVVRREPLHDIHSHSSDSFRYFAEAVEAGRVARSTGWDDEPQGQQRAVGCEWLGRVW